MGALRWESFLGGLFGFASATRANYIPSFAAGESFGTSVLVAVVMLYFAPRKTGPLWLDRRLSAATGFRWAALPVAVMGIAAWYRGFGYPLLPWTLSAIAAGFLLVDFATGRREGRSVN